MITAPASGGLLAFCSASPPGNLAVDNPSRTRGAVKAAGPPGRSRRKPSPRHGITPTCWGAGRGDGRCDSAVSDHPHVRGEHERPTPMPRPEKGPSPRAWGAPAGLLGGHRRDRTIPTCVGSTGSASHGSCGTPDHPHVRGEHVIHRLNAFASGGPSPRAWGAPRAEPGAGHADRTIPTCVGSTPPTWSGPPPSSDHPHVRGEHLAAIGVKGTPHGPIPRAWGAPKEAAHLMARFRTIPTCVGSTS